MPNNWRCIKLWHGCIIDYYMLIITHALKILNVLRMYSCKMLSEKRHSFVYEI